MTTRESLGDDDDKPSIVDGTMRGTRLRIVVLLRSTFARVSHHGHNPERRQKESTGEMCVRFLELTKESTHSLIKNTVSSELFLVPSLLRHVSKSFTKDRTGD